MAHLKQFYILSMRYLKFYSTDILTNTARKMWTDCLNSLYANLLNAQNKNVNFLCKCCSNFLNLGFRITNCNFHTPTTAKALMKFNNNF